MKILIDFNEVPVDRRRVTLIQHPEVMTDFLMETGLLPYREYMKPVAQVGRNRSRVEQRKMREIRKLDPMCRYCLTQKSTTADHIIPRCIGGPSTYWNMVGCCATCNKKKASYTLKEFTARTGLRLHVPARFLIYKGGHARYGFKKHHDYCIDKDTFIS